MSKKRAKPQKSQVNMVDEGILKRKAEFARRLRALMLDRGWNQSEVARRASVFLAQPMGRDNISLYLKAGSKTMPRPLHLHALTRAFDVDPSVLMGDSDLSATLGPETGMRRIPGEPTKAILRINQEVPYAKALKILQMLEESDDD